ncbi:uncharacterized protein LOC129598476 isoform X2 [Paramacrobiotus metropolitanus]|uniref:uncharacterized protein LOC129598476 isoform X2 n=1 Tax=Paramacrobiotus metropolitanus TaxID=2943436 RepID=UPI002445DBC5|nr:uncharacterized protein LOC129598476 isoform X2 [Paramacrobiotus metropolitanus]
MSSAAFDDYIRRSLENTLCGEEVQRVYGMTCKGQAYVFIITKVFWHAVYWFAEPEPLHEDTSSERYGALNKEWNGEFLAYKQFLVLDRAEAWIRSMQRELGDPAQFTGLKFLAFRVRELPPDCARYPDTFLQPGDHIRGPFAGKEYHEGIYIGQGQVVHFSGQGNDEPQSDSKTHTLVQRKLNAGVRLGEFYPDFVNSYDDKVEIIEYRLRLRSPEEIVAAAIDYAAEKFSLGDYNLVQNNCQHFASLCATGLRVMCGDMLYRTGTIRNGLVRLQVPEPIANRVSGYKPRGKKS